jgi:hypothetical protein
VHDPDISSRAAPSHLGPATGELGPHALQILMTEHWSLLASRSLVYTEAMSRASMFIAALTGSVVALALVAQATDFGDGFVAFALVLLPVVFFLGFATVVRLSQVNYEDALWVQGMNRIRNAYHELAPELEPYFVTSRYDDHFGVLQSTLGRRHPPSPLQVFVAVPGVVALIDSVVAGAAVAIAGLGLGAGMAVCLALGVLGFAAALACFVLWARRAIAGLLHVAEVRFPTPT